MACEKTIRLNDVGTRFKFTVKECIDGVDTIVDISAANNIAIYFKKPTINNVEGEVLTRVGTKTNGGADGLVHYVTIADDMNVLGDWEGQAKVIMTVDTAEFSSSIMEFSVVENLL